jgi:hypothetical protein
MLAVLNPTYSLRVIIKDALPENASYQTGIPGQQAGSIQAANGRKWYNGLTGKTGCDDVLSAVRDALNKVGIQAEVSLDKFEHR